MEKTKAQASFKPQMNTHSAYMVKKKGGRVPIYEQEPQDVRRGGVDEHCTFRPKTNRRRG